MGYIDFLGKKTTTDLTDNIKDFHNLTDQFFLK